MFYFQESPELCRQKSYRIWDGPTFSVYGPVLMGGASIEAVGRDISWAWCGSVGLWYVSRGGSVSGIAMPILRGFLLGPLPVGASVVFPPACHPGARVDSYVCVLLLRRNLGLLHTSHSHGCLFLFLSLVVSPSSVGINTSACGCISSGPGIGVGRGLFL